jgi:hypothetical protein
VEKHCPLIYDPAFGQGINLSEDFFVTDFDFDGDQDFVAAAELINRCYQTHNHDAGEIAGWCQQPVFDDELRIWAQARRSNEKVGLGISIL